MNIYIITNNRLVMEYTNLHKVNCLLVDADATGVLHVCREWVLEGYYLINDPFLGNHAVSNPFLTILLKWDEDMFSSVALQLAAQSLAKLQEALAWRRGADKFFTTNVSRFMRLDYALACSTLDFSLQEEAIV